MPLPQRHLGKVGAGRWGEIFAMRIEVDDGGTMKVTWPKKY